MSKGRPDGNPDIRKWSYRTDRSEPLTEQVALRISASMKAQLPRGRGSTATLTYKNLARGAIAAWIENRTTIEELDLTDEELEAFVCTTITEKLRDYC
jgi:hypothetical protein